MKEATSTRVEGHGLRDGGAGWVKADTIDGRWQWHRNTYDGWGHGRCMCGASSPFLGTTSERKQWHREHKALVIALLEPAP